MSRIQNLRVELDIDGNTIYPVEMGEFAPGGKDTFGEGVDGNLKYKFKTAQKEIGEVEVIVNKKADRVEYDILNKFAKSNLAKDVIVSGLNNIDVVEEKFLFLACQCAVDNRSKPDRKSSEPDTQKFILLPKDIVEVL